MMSIFQDILKLGCTHQSAAQFKQTVHVSFVDANLALSFQRAVAVL